MKSITSDEPSTAMRPRKMLPGVGIFGTSALSRGIAVILKNCGFKLVAVWSRTTKEAADFAKDFDIPFSTNKVDGLLLLPEVGFVMIVCAPHLQSPIAVKALGIGKHVLAIPPAGPSQVEVLKMVKAASYYPSLLSMLCHGLRFLPAYTKMKQYLESGWIGELYLFEIKVHGSNGMQEFGWECDVMMGGGALSMQGMYIIDIITYLCGKKAKSVHGLLKTFVKQTASINGIRQITSDDFCSFQMELEGGVIVSCVLNNHCQGEYTHELTAVGSRGRLVIRDMDLYSMLNKDNGTQHVLHSESMEPVACADDSCRVPFSKGMQRALQCVANAFLDMADAHGWNPSLIPDRATFDDALYAQTVVDAIRKSSQTREWVKIEILEEEPDPNPNLSAAVRRSGLYAFS